MDIFFKLTIIKGSNFGGTHGPGIAGRPPAICQPLQEARILFQVSRRISGAVS